MIGWRAWTPNNNGAPRVASGTTTRPLGAEAGEEGEGRG